MVFSHLFRFDIENFPVYFLSGLIIFSFFSEATSISMNSIISNSSLINKVYMPKYIFPVSKVLSSAINLGFAFVALMMVMMVTNVNISATILLFPIAFLYVIVFTLGFSLILSTLAVFFRDVIHLYGVLLMAWMYFTPIIYPINIIPEKYLIILRLNPMYYLVEYFRHLSIYSTMPSLELNIYCLLISLTSLVIGLVVFKNYQNKFIMYI
jgi:ABC-2 type transport system permease protein